MPGKTVTLHNEHGLHARPAAIFTNAAKKHEGSVTVAKGGKEANAKSVLSVLTLECHKGDSISIVTDGLGAEEALDELVRLVEDGLGE